jgi:hypothetical protein
MQQAGLAEDQLEFVRILSNVAWGPPGTVRVMTRFLATHRRIDFPLERILQCIELLATGNRLAWTRFTMELQARALIPQVPQEVVGADNAADTETETSMLTEPTVSSTGGVADGNLDHHEREDPDLAVFEQGVAHVAGEDNNEEDGEAHQDDGSSGGVN